MAGISLPSMAMRLRSATHTSGVCDNASQSSTSGSTAFAKRGHNPSRYRTVFSSAIGFGTDVRHIAYTYCLLILAATQDVFAASTVSGRVIDDQGKPVAGAVVFVQEPVTDRAGDKQTAVMDQFNKTFIPGVLPIVV